jgi:hypothetical protein
MNKRYFFFAVSVAAVLILTGCQSQQTERQSPEQNPQVVPYSKGPDGPPAVKGPTEFPPGTDETAAAKLPQAVSETENVKYSL